ncbi:GntR family transcriptional regulator [Thermoactinomyces mirandus]|uniref:GntR family transcriptional regulator n=1 Tax=Thermoactinomyces mirandus TaxID=2756294 RepID=A0A7W1XSX9_9BACL|nr:GntR family transcriptional regulator [Thermoactinomyces mirandus]MBA4602596.1 GntR family transcriptional regulator [Thermoactinomyces mirandus]
MRRVSKESPIPLYYQLKEILQEMIDNEELKPGDMIPPERELCEFQGISRMTARKAILALVNEGVLYRAKGKGTFVAEPKPKHLLQLKGFTEEMKEQGFTVRTRILSFQITKATLKLKKQLKMEQDQELVYEIRRLRIVNDMPFAIETVWLNHGKLPGLKKEMLEDSLYSVLGEKYHLYPEYAQQTIEPIMLNEYECGLLGTNPPSLAILFRRTTYSKQGEVMEYTKCIYRTDSHKYEVYLHP